MDKPQYTSVPKEELRRMESDVHRAESLDELRVLFDRLQSMRRTFLDDFDLQLAIAQVHQTIVERGRALVESGQDWSRGAGAGGNSAAIYLDPPPREQEREAERPEQALPPHVEQLDAKSWKRATYIGAFLAILLFAAFFYLVQTARRLNMPAEEAGQKSAAGVKAVPAQDKPKPSAPAGPVLRLYTDLVPGTVAIDGAAPQPLQDGELQLDNLKPGHHSVKLTGRTGDASFEFDTTENLPPHLSAPPAGNEVIIVTASTQKGQGQLMTNAGVDARITLDGKDLGPVASTGLPLTGLGETDHELQINAGSSAQRFILTFIAAPALTVYVKSDLNAGSLMISTGEDGVDVYLDNVLYRRKTQHGELRLPTLKVGPHTIRVAKPGFAEVAPQTVQIKKGEEARLVFKLQPQQLATVEVRGGQAGVQISLDGVAAATTDANGNATLSNVKPGEHTLTLRHEGFEPKEIRRPFNAGETVTLTAPEATLAAMPAQNASTQNTTQPQNAAGPPESAAPSPAGPAAPTAQAPKAAEPNAGAGETAPAPAAAATPAIMPGTIHHGGGFLIYHSTKAPGRYSFSMQLRKGGGFMKGKRLQWFLGYRNTKNYVAFQLDGKHFIVRQVVDGKSEELRKVPFDASLDTYVQIDQSVKPNGVETRLREPDGQWQSMGGVTVPGEDFTKGSFGVLISGNDEVGVSAVHYGK